MNTKYDFAQPDENRIVYVRPVDVSDLPEDLREQAGDRDRIYAVHASDGERLALVADRRMAFILAQQNDFAAVNVH